MNTPTGNTPTPDLAAAPGGEPKRIAQLEQALRETRDCIINGGGGGVCDTVWYHGSPAETLVDYIDSQLGIPASMSVTPAAETAPDAGLLEALEFIAEEHDAGRHDGLPEPCPAHDADMMFAVARAALARAGERT